MTDDLLDQHRAALAGVVELFGELTLAATQNQRGAVAHVSTYGVQAYEDALTFFGIVSGTPFVEARRQVGTLVGAIRRGDLSGITP